MADADLHALPALLGADDPAIYAIHRAQGRFMPLHQRLERASQDRFIVSARKPG